MIRGKQLNLSLGYFCKYKDFNGSSFMWYLSGEKKKFLRFSAEKYSWPQCKAVLILSASDLAFGGVLVRIFLI